MIQRIQSLWLFLAGLLSACLFVTWLYKAHQLTNGMDTEQLIRVNDHYPSLLLAVVMTLLPLVSIFMFKNRKRQRSLTVISILSVIGFLALTLMRVSDFNNNNPDAGSGTYGLGAILPVAALIFLILAVRGINKDEKLVKSLDRLR